LTELLDSVFMDLLSFFDSVYLTIFFKNIEFSKANKLHIFIVIKYHVIYHWIDNKMLFQKKYLSPTFSPSVGLGSRSKADFEKKIASI